MVSLNYVVDYYHNLAKNIAILYMRLKKNPSLWTNENILAVRKLRQMLSIYFAFI